MRWSRQNSASGSPLAIGEQAGMEWRGHGLKQLSRTAVDMGRQHFCLNSASMGQV